MVLVSIELKWKHWSRKALLKETEVAFLKKADLMLILVIAL